MCGGEQAQVGETPVLLDASTAHFRSLRSTRASQRAKAVAFVEQVWELAHALEQRVQLPTVDLPGFNTTYTSAAELPGDTQPRPGDCAPAGAWAGSRFPTWSGR
jgi:hypothetical protein